MSARYSTPSPHVSDPLHAHEPPAAALADLPMKGAITFFYYQDLGAARDFYERIVGLERVQDFGWCCLLSLQPGCHLGLVDGTSSRQRPIEGRNKGVLLSIEMADLEACLERFRQLGVADPASRIEPGCSGRTREFRIFDPEGYAIEFFTWLTPLSS
ncbi:MAG: VOC family protein [Steroidobacteraceae bacterium]